jgi:hypothetical protein
VVTVQGFMHSEFESYSIWDMNPARSAGTARTHCISLLIPRSMDTDRFHMQYVSLRGRFVKQPPAGLVHLGGCNTTSLELQGLPVLIRKPLSSRPNNSSKPTPLRGAA